MQCKDSGDFWFLMKLPEEAFLQAEGKPMQNLFFLSAVCA